MPGIEVTLTYINLEFRLPPEKQKSTFGSPNLLDVCKEDKIPQIKPLEFPQNIQ
jgi:hypothetical protein